jgi:hypothetical protein
MLPDLMIPLLFGRLRPLTARVDAQRTPHVAPRRVDEQFSCRAPHIRPRFEFPPIHGASFMRHVHWCAHADSSVTRQDADY